MSLEESTRRELEQFARSRSLAVRAEFPCLIVFPAAEGLRNLNSVYIRGKARMVALGSNRFLSQGIEGVEGH